MSHSLSVGAAFCSFLDLLVPLMVPLWISPFVCGKGEGFATVTHSLCGIRFGKAYILTLCLSSSLSASREQSLDVSRKWTETVEFGRIWGIRRQSHLCVVKSCRFLF